MIGVCARVKIGSAVYAAASAVIDKIDRLATALTIDAILSPAPARPLPRVSERQRKSMMRANVGTHRGSRNLLRGDAIHSD
jgi:hypothetical protein